MHSRGDSAMLCVLCSSPDWRIYIVETKTTCCLCLQSSQKFKNYFGSIHRTPLAYASCFTAQLTSIAQRVAVARNRCFSATAPQCSRAVSNSFSITDCMAVPLLDSHGQKGETQSFWSFHDNVIAQQTDTEIGTRL